MLEWVELGMGWEDVPLGDASVLIMYVDQFTLNCNAVQCVLGLISICNY